MGPGVNADGVHKLVLGMKGGQGGRRTTGISKQCCLNCMVLDHRTQITSPHGRRKNENEISFWKSHSPAQNYGRDLTCRKINSR